MVLLGALFALGTAWAEGLGESGKENYSTEKKEKVEQKKSRFILGGYGEAVYSRNFYSDNYLRYTNAEKYRNGNYKHGRFDLPHVVVYFGYDFGKGWTMGTEIEFEHGGTESAMEIEDEEGGEYESEIETGVSLWGQAGDWRYEVLLLPGLDSDRFGRENWIQGGAGSPYEFKIANSIAGAFRVDNFSIPGLRLSLSGYIGNSFSNTLREANSSYADVKGTVAVGAFDFHYDDHNWVVRGNFDYGHLTDSDRITTFNKDFRDDSPSPKQNVASDALAAGIEAGYDFFSQINKLSQKGQKFYVFARYDYYDSMYKTAKGVMDYEWCGRHRIAAGVNYYPLKDIVLKGEYSIGLLKKAYNNEPSLSFGIAYAGLFNL